MSDPARQAQVQASGAYKQGLRYKEGLEVAKRNLKTLSDAGCSHRDGHGHGTGRTLAGFFEHLELEMMVEAGMTPMQVIVAATGAAAGVTAARVSSASIQPGASADLLVLDANPLDDIRNTRQIQSIWITGRPLQ